MKETINVCPKCGQVLPENAKFCVSCGYDFREGTSMDRAVDTLKSRLSFRKSTTLKQATEVKAKAMGMVTPEKAAETVQSMIDVVTYVAQDLKQGMSSEMVKAVDVSARVNFVAFSVGVTIDLEKLPLPDKKQSTG
jgi:uncharacterized Zn finger protein (UPF0148 family)